MAIVSCNHFSYYLGMDMTMSVLLPEKRQQKPVARPDKKYPVLYLLHGHSDDHTAFLRKSLIELLVRDRDLIVVMPNGHRGFYTDGAQAHLYFRYIAEELPVLAGNFFPVSSDPAETYIAGISMGGYGAMKTALNYPERFAGVGLLSAALIMDDILKIGEHRPFTVPDFEQNLERVFGPGRSYEGTVSDLGHLLRVQDKAGGFGPRIYQCCGTGDFIHEQNTRFRDLVQSLAGRWDHRFEDGPGEHNWDFWNAYLPRMLRHFGLIDDGVQGIVRPVNSQAE